MKSQDVLEKLSYAKRRYEDLCALNGGDLPGADRAEKQMLVQEFFFHLVGAIEYLAQFVNEERKLGIPYNMVSVTEVRNTLDKQDALHPIFSFIYTSPNSSNNPLKNYQSDTDEILIYRLWNYRNQVAHRGRQAFLFLRPEQEAKLKLDPRHLSWGAAQKTVQADLIDMYALVDRKIHEALNLLAPSPTPASSP